MSFGFQLSDLKACCISPNSAGRSRSDPATNGTIHPFWRQENFRRGTLEDEARNLPSRNIQLWGPQGMISDHIYHRMVPALQLATSMLQACTPFFQKLMYADIGASVDADLSEFLIFDPDYEACPSEAREYCDDLVDIAGYYRVFTGASVTALEKSGDTRVLPDATFLIVTCVASEFFQLLESPRFASLSTEAL